MASNSSNDSSATTAANGSSSAANSTNSTHATSAPGVPVNQIPVSIPPPQPSVTELREQIFANAMTLFPHFLIGIPNSQASPGVINPQAVFEVIITNPQPPHFQAMLVYGSVLSRRVCMRGPLALSIQGALYELLRTSSEVMARNVTTLLGSLEYGSTTAYGGEVDASLVEEGFDFAYMQRWRREQGEQQQQQEQKEEEKEEKKDM